MIIASLHECAFHMRRAHTLVYSMDAGFPSDPNLVPSVPPVGVVIHAIDMLLALLYILVISRDMRNNPVVHRLDSWLAYLLRDTALHWISLT